MNNPLQPHNPVFGIRHKMVLVLITVMTIALSASGWISYREQESEVARETSKRGEDIARFVASAVAGSVVAYDYTSLKLLLDNLASAQDIAFAKVVNSQGNSMAEVGRTNGEGRAWKSFKHDIVLDQQKVGEITIALDNSRIVRNLSEKKWTMIQREAVLIALIAIGEFMALSFLIARPVGVIQYFLQNIVDEKGHITQDIPINTHDEFGTLAQLFNSMRARLNEANDKLQNRIDLTDNQLNMTNARLLEQAKELQRMNSELEKLAVTDTLTGLFNRRQFQSVMENEITECLKVGDSSSLAIIDIDHFKSINDSYGHKYGDLILIDMARLLKSFIRKEDTLCRIGGEEFVVMCRHTSKEESRAIGEKLRKIVEDNVFQLHTRKISVTVSIGLDTLPDGATLGTTDDIFQRADFALYYSKKNGRNRVTHYSDIPASERTTSEVNSSHV